MKTIARIALIATPLVAALAAVLVTLAVRAADEKKAAAAPRQGRRSP